MKMVVAIVRPEKYGEVKDALKDRGVTGMTFTHVTGRGMQAGVKFTNRVGDFVVDELEKVKIEVVSDDSAVDGIIRTIHDAAVTGNPGDGRIFIIPVEKSIKIRTGEA